MGKTETPCKISQHNWKYEHETDRRACNEGLNKITAADWLGFSQHVAKLEQKFWANDGIMEDVIKSFIITLSAGDSDSSSEDNGDCSDSECDSLLALPLDEESND
jgi:hypothetical protein